MSDASSFLWVDIDQRDGRMVVSHAMRRDGDAFDNFGAFSMDRAAAIRLADKIKELAERMS